MFLLGTLKNFRKVEILQSLIKELENAGYQCRIRKNVVMWCTPAHFASSSFKNDEGLNNTISRMQRDIANATEGIEVY